MVASVGVGVGGLENPRVEVFKGSGVGRAGLADGVVGCRRRVFGLWAPGEAQTLEQARTGAEERENGGDSYASILPLY